MDWLLVWLAAMASQLASDDLQWAGVLDDLDEARAVAFATADPDRLDDVYVSDSAAREADAGLIGEYAQRGGRVIGAGLILESCVVRKRSADRVTLGIVDRLAPARVEWDDGTSRALPRDLPTRRVVTLVRTAHGWRIA